MKYNIGDTVYIRAEVVGITIRGETTTYEIRDDIDTEGWWQVKEEELKSYDCVPLDDYEREINGLKEDVRQWQDMYQGEHLKVEKLRAQLDLLKIAEELKWQEETSCGEIDCERIKPSDFSHNPEKNTYAKPMHNFDDWRLP